MRIIDQIRNNRMFYRITIIIVAGWFFFVLGTTLIYGSGITDLRDAEFVEVEAHYTELFNDINERAKVLSAYYTEESVLDVDSVFNQYKTQTLADLDMIQSISVSVQGVITYAWPSSEQDQIGYDILLNANSYESGILLDSLENNTISYLYRTNQDDEVTIMYIRNPIYIDDIFYGFVTITIDPEILKINDSNVHSTIIDIAIFNRNEETIFGINEFKTYNSKEITIDGQVLIIGEQASRGFMLSRGSLVVLFLIAVTGVVIGVYYYIYRHFVNHTIVSSELDFRKNYDPETRIYNIDKLYSDLSDLVDHKKVFYLCFLNINNMKYINEKFGHNQTSKLLFKTTSMINRVLRHNSNLYRYGGDEYVLIIKTDNTSEVKNIMRRIASIFEADIVSDSIRARLGINIGVASFPIHGKSSEQLIKNAHVAASSINPYDKESFKFYREDQLLNKEYMDGFDEKVSTLDLELFEVYLMPIVQVKNNKIAGFECLTRAFDQYGETLPTQEVIMSLERYGRIQELDEIVFKKMLQIMKRINKEFPDQDYFLSINASALSLNDEYVERIIKYYQNANLKRGQIVLELTESYQVDDYDYLIDLFKKLNKKGIKIAIDDFGSGYSSISYISKFPIYAIKVDKEYVRDYRDNDFNQTLLMTLKSIAEVLKCRLVAEGVDSVETLEFLKETGCPYYQGFYFSKGVTLDDAISLTKENSQKNKR